MNIIVNILQEDYDLFFGKSKIKCKYYDESMLLFYFDINNKCSLLNVGDVIFFYMYGYPKYYSIVKEIQPKLIPMGETRIYFDIIYENKDWKKTKIPKFYGVKYIPDVIYDPKEEGQD
jgi:hypothetical protein